MFLPYRLDSGVPGLPLLTLIVCVVCIAVYWQQYSRDQAHYQSADRFCGTQLSDSQIRILRRVVHGEVRNPCYSLMEYVRSAPSQDDALWDLSVNAEPIEMFGSAEEDANYIYNRLYEIYNGYEAQVPAALTDELAYAPDSFDIRAMISSTFSHGDLMHLAGNLLFFFIFAAAVELVLGHIAFFIFIALSTFGTSLAYSYATANVPDALPTIGLSGVVMAMLAAMAVMLPTARIRCFIWILVFFRVIRVPAILLAVWYVGWDVYAMNMMGASSPINYVAHVSGAAIGALVGLYYLIFQKEKVSYAASA